MTIEISRRPHPKLDELIAVLEYLRAPGGCAWDREQTPSSLVQYLIEETYELVDAIEGGKREDLIEELGDVLYQVIFHSDIAAESGSFDIEEVAARMTAKMVGRHPHVFSDTPADSVDDVIAVWNAAKAIEKSHRTSVLDGIPLGMPSLALADKLLGRASRIGLDPSAAQSGSQSGALADSICTSFTDEQQLGSVLLGIVATAKVQGLDAERALRITLRSLQDEVRRTESRVAG